MKKLWKHVVLLLLLISSFTTLSAATLSNQAHFNNVVIFIRFNDEQTYSAPYTYNHYEEMLNGVGVESLRDYYLEASYGQLTIDSIIPNDNGTILYYTDIYDRSYYEPYDETTNPDGYSENESASREHNLLKRAVDYADAENWFDESVNLDVNNDGMIDSITFMVSGEDNGWNSLLWPHKWELYSFGSEGNFSASAPTINGVHAYYYTFELLGNSTTYDYQVTVGILAHETFHLLGAPDLYHYYYYLDVVPVGYWGLMQYQGDIPSHMLGYMKEEYGLWLDETQTISDSGTYTLYPLGEGEHLMRLYTGFENEWIYLEYRLQDGRYESNLPDSGLLVYRVNQNVDGNEYGSYYNGEPSDEVFIFRPGLDDVIEPIILEEEGDIDGDIDLAALSNDNIYSAIGLGTSIPLFSADGTILNIRIDNIIEQDGYITFDVSFPIRTYIMSETFELDNINVQFWDNEEMDYRIGVENIPQTQEVRYTTDGTTPTLASPLVPVDGISIDAMNNVVTLGIFEDDVLLSTQVETYQFSSTIESNHHPYGNYMSQYYYLDFGVDHDFNISFHSSSKLEEYFDYLYLFDGTVTESFTGTEMRSFDQSYHQEEFLVLFDTDDTIDNFYGFTMNIDTVVLPNFELSGNAYNRIPVGTTYTDPGYILDGLNTELYHVEVTGTYDTDIVGSYTITYDLLDDENTIIKTLTRTVEVVDDVSPEVTLNGYELTIIEAGSVYEDLGVNITDNYDSNPSVTITENVDTSVLGDYIVTYTVQDSSLNQTVITRTVRVIDTTAPVLTMNGDDELHLEVFSDYLDEGVTGVDNLDPLVNILTDSNLDLSVLGEYTITYRATDENGNSSSITRTIHVVDTTNPVLTLTGDSDVTIEVFDSYTDAGFELHDNYDTDVAYTIDESLDLSTVGTYTITFTATDSSNNQTIVTRTVNVVDTVAPEGTLNNGLDTIYVGETWEDGGVSYSDNYTESPTLETDGDVDTSAPGEYVVTYTITDESGNETVRTRIISVLEKQDLEITCDAMVTTAASIDDLMLGDCMVGTEKMTVHTSDIRSNPGIYEVNYSLDVHGTTYHKTIYVYITGGTYITTEIAIERREDYV
ncbi:immunoglobulin-like domain-containing protein [Candidatus Xianfuyuplasma coldseepsis]|uniref:DUF5011 domain-containing protein n=1 Tax=Candidatus Xianfuyuplasma coldseepsis TaxID=2782163 RepID=A0A7L7KR84_9MOLU|nr:immunoglobulin-like domain-containing protein [Xianfuyuplasma coldseepsis]QMS85095.1 DUF5011 domain-containing protein [Xianfuyuplasma coldseepsis]